MAPVTHRQIQKGERKTAAARTGNGYNQIKRIFFPRHLEQRLIMNVGISTLSYLKYSFTCCNPQRQLVNACEPNLKQELKIFGEKHCARSKAHSHKDEISNETSNNEWWHDVGEKS